MSGRARSAPQPRTHRVRHVIRPKPDRPLSNLGAPVVPSGPFLGVAIVAFLLGIVGLVFAILAYMGEGETSARAGPGLIVQDDGRTLQLAPISGGSLLASWDAAAAAQVPGEVELLPPLAFSTEDPDTSTSAPKLGLQAMGPATLLGNAREISGTPTEVFLDSTLRFEAQQLGLQPQAPGTVMTNPHGYEAPPTGLVLSTGALLSSDGVQSYALPIGTAGHYLRVNGGGTGLDWAPGLAPGPASVPVTTLYVPAVTGIFGAAPDGATTVIRVLQSTLNVPLSLLQLTLQIQCEIDVATVATDVGGMELLLDDNPPLMVAGYRVTPNPALPTPNAALYSTALASGRYQVSGSPDAVLETSAVVSATAPRLLLSLVNPAGNMENPNSVQLTVTAFLNVEAIV